MGANTSSVSKKPVAIFLDDPDLVTTTADKFIQKLLKDKPEIQNYNWLYKNHPRVSRPSETLHILRKYFKNVSVIPNKIPLESFLSVDFPIDYVAGYGSSIFFSFKKEQILGYLRRLHLEVYEESLLKIGILTPDLVFTDTCSITP